MNQEESCKWDEGRNMIQYTQIIYHYSKSVQGVHDISLMWL